MHKHELVGITIEQLLEHFKTSPESFEHYNYMSKPAHMNPTIYWQPRVQLGDCMSPVVDDPNNRHAVIVIWDVVRSELTCYVFLKAPATLINNHCYAADSVMSSCRMFEKWRSNYRSFKKLSKLIQARDKRKENLTYLKKLSAVFPDTLDTHLLDK